MPKSRIAAAQIDLHWVVHPVDQKRSVLNALDGSRQSARLLPTNLVFSPPPMHCGISDICCLAPNDVSQIFEHWFARWFAFSYQLSGGRDVPLRADDLAKGVRRLNCKFSKCSRGVGKETNSTSHY